MNTITTKITRIQDIPYCGSSYIEGFWNSDFGEIKSYEAVSGFPHDDDLGDPHYFRAEWRQSIHKARHGEYQEL